MDKIVTGCFNCPFKSEGSESMFSHNADRRNINQQEIELIYTNDEFPPPSWCPLKVESITIKIKENG